MEQSSNEYVSQFVTRVDYILKQCQIAIEDEAEDDNAILGNDKAIRYVNSDGNLKTVSACNESSDEGNSDPEDHTHNEEETMESQADQRGQDTAIHGYASSPPDMTDQGSTQDSGIDKSIIVAKKTYTPTKRKFSQNASTISNLADAAFIGWLKNKQERDSSKENPNISFLRSFVAGYDENDR
ncbi:hypothetical protein Trydic_g13266 [Trypoxylus dichotomus]